ncbi:MAG: ribonuclease HII [Pedosphaera sp.]|nr:ribonuclease HII [Pedosphaera sp.]
MDVDRFFPEQELLARGIYCIAGVDEAGRGPLAGPVTAAAVILPAIWYVDGIPSALVNVNDSKQLSESQRNHFFELLTQHPQIHFAIASVESSVIDRINILAATHRAMNEALGRLSIQPSHVLVDGNRVESMALPHTPLVKGDSRSYSIAAASVLAKVTRDRHMHDADIQWPQYGFAQHKGYPTAAHRAAIARHGPCPIHRLSFAPLKTANPQLFPT